MSTTKFSALHDIFSFFRCGVFFRLEVNDARRLPTILLFKWMTFSMFLLLPTPHQAIIMTGDTFRVRLLPLFPRLRGQYANDFGGLECQQSSGSTPSLVVDRSCFFSDVTTWSCSGAWAVEYFWWVFHYVLWVGWVLQWHLGVWCFRVVSKDGFGQYKGEWTEWRFA